METQDNIKNNQLIRNQRIGLIILVVILLLAMLAIVVYMVRMARLNNEHQELQNERLGLLEEQHRQSSELLRNDSLIARLRLEIEGLTAANEEHQRNLNAQAAGLRRHSAENQELRDQLEAYRLMEQEYNKMQAQYAHLLGEYENLDLSYDKLESRYNSLRDSVEHSKGLRALNITALSKWERWLWADRYNVSQARRIDETRIAFEIWGSHFTPHGERTVYLSMVDPSGAVMYPAPADTNGSETEFGTPYTQKQEVTFSGNPVPMTFTIKHPERLVPGIYMVRVYVDAEPVGSQQLVLE
jgi:hypothetical protein